MRYWQYQKWCYSFIRYLPVFLIHVFLGIGTIDLEALLLSWVNFDSSMDKLLHTSQGVGDAMAYQFSNLNDADVWE